ncbi:MAG: LysR family transcriptional regulator [Paralcaligenes sp.]
MATSLNDIALFVEVAKRKNFSRAAEALDMPVSTLSRRISELERQIGVRLLKRSTRKMELTEAGSVYFERCQHIVAEARIAHEQLLEVAQLPKGRLHISMPASFSLIFMPIILRDFCEQYPDIECQLDLGINPIDLLADSFDIVIRFGSQPDSGVISRLITNVPICLYASSGYLARYGAPLLPNDLPGHQCLRAGVGKEDSTWVLTSGSKIEKVPVAGRLAINNIVMLQRMALQGLGIAPLPTHWSVNMGMAERLQRVLPEWEFKPIPLLALFPSRMVPAKVRVFIEFLQTRLAAVLVQEKRPLKTS